MFDKELIKKVIYDTISADLVEQVIIFGSRARNEATADSDTDICIVFKDELPREEMKKYRAAMNRKFAREHRMPTDIVMKSNYAYNRYKGVVGALEYDIAHEGIAI